jgi:uncharacterized membrane protein YbhN (UPF0104 family)
MAAAALPAEETQSDFTLPALDVRGLARRGAIPAALVAAVAAFVVAAGGPLDAFADALRRALDADPVWVGAAAAFELLSFGGYVALLWLVGGRASSRMGARESTQVTLGGAAATRLLPTAGVGGAALTLWALKRSGLTTRGASRTLLTFLILLYSVFLGSIAVTGTLLTVQGEGPIVLTALPAAAAIAGMVIALVAGAARPSRTGRVWTAATVLGESVRDAIAHLRSGDVRLLGTLAWWGFDMAVLWAMLHAFGAPPAFAIVVLAYFVGQVGNTIPIPGAVSGGLVGVLLAFGVDADLAIVSVLAYRAIAIWVPVPVGLASLRGLRRTIARWGRDDEAPKLTVVPPATRPLPLPYEGRAREAAWPRLEPAAA